jgi:hypothetical protein
MCSPDPILLLIGKRFSKIVLLEKLLMLLEITIKLNAAVNQSNKTEHQDQLK